MPIVIGHETAQARKRAITDWNGFTRGLLGMTVTGLARSRVLHEHINSRGQQCRSDPPTAQCGSLACMVGLAVPIRYDHITEPPNRGLTFPEAEPAGSNRVGRMAQPPRQLKSRRIEDSGIDALDYDSKWGKYRVRLERPDFDGHLGVRRDAAPGRAPPFLTHALVRKSRPAGVLISTQVWPS